MPGCPGPQALFLTEEEARFISAEKPGTGPTFLPMLTYAAACLFYAGHMGTPENILAQNQAQESGVGGWEFPSSAAAVVGSSGTGDGAASQAGFHHLHELVRE